MSGPRMIRVDHPSEADEAVIRRALIEHNDQWLGRREALPLCLLVKDGPRVLGGLLASTARAYLHLDALWVGAELRGQGHGSRMVRAAETEALARGCVGAWLDTYSFAARPFYERLGYEVFGALEGYPGGHTRWFMRKRLVAGEG